MTNTAFSTIGVKCLHRCKWEMKVHNSEGRIHFSGIHSPEGKAFKRSLVCCGLRPIRRPCCLGKRKAACTLEFCECSQASEKVLKIPFYKLEGKDNPFRCASSFSDNIYYIPSKASLRDGGWLESLHAHKSYYCHYAYSVFFFLPNSSIYTLENTYQNLFR